MDNINLNPLELLKIFSLSTLIQEINFINETKEEKNFQENRLLTKNSILPKKYLNKTPKEIFQAIIYDSLSFNYKETINWALILRQKYKRKITPQIIMVEAAIHPNRVQFNEKFPGDYSQINIEVMDMPEDPIIQYKYYLNKNGKPNNLPNILKRNWARKIESLSPYSLSQFHQKDSGMIETIKICHAKGEHINQLLQTGYVNIPHEFKTWNNLRANNYDWIDILEMMKISNNSILMNMVNILKEVDDENTIKMLMKELRSNVRDENHLPFRYYSTIRSIEKENILHSKNYTIKELTKCLEDASDLLPSIHGRTICLSDNSNSSNTIFNYSYGNLTSKEINNLHSILIAKNSDEGYVGKFNSHLDIFEISNDVDILNTCKEMNQSTNDKEFSEDGIWVFLINAIQNKEIWDNIIIFSDQQPAYGELFQNLDILKKEYSIDGQQINIIQIINEYRNLVNNKVNVFFIKTTPYDNISIPEFTYRTTVLNNWNGKETKFIKEINKFWDKFDNN